jgi:hypothetical protein
MIQMTNEFMFMFLSYCAGPFWLLILFAPQNKKSMLAVDLFLFALSGLFVWHTLPVFGEVLPLLLEPSFHSMHEFLSSPSGFIGTWNHMILGDVWIGRWMAQDTLKYSKSNRGALITRLVFIPWVLFLGPFGLFFYLAYRFIVLKRLFLTEAS